MSQSEQERLYKHFILTSKEGKTDIIRANALGYAKQILESYPQFKVEEVKKEVIKPKEKPKNDK